MVNAAAATGSDVFSDGLPLDEDYAGPRDLTVETVLSADGTPIAYEKSGSGPPVVILGGGLNDKAMFTPLVTHMSKRFTVYNYDRRGRGDSGYGDPDQYTIQVEVEDLAAVLDAVGEPSHVFANCTGGQIAILAAAAGVPMMKLGLYEPPYWSPAVTTEQLATLKQFIAEDRRDEAVTLFGRDIVGFLSDETLDYFKQHPAWSAFRSMAPSTYYDAIISKDHSQIPHEELPKITVPTLVMRGDEGEQEIHDSCARVADEIPGATLLTKEGYNHLFDQDAWASSLMEFFEPSS
ncbi:alpha/beta fold hydrolase [Streptomyces cahuitamycinicus]|uniref:Alpha/beta hydrolase n=1 Tax=Streptomyces cahuitamycinicus TaxID=2070367 RepID=A0A2N8TXW9_9ACTN|nr:alpha/beta hydrolase [Streptomyces cahuitamycinicus]PNG23820.1 alpha/beta hydrolase [Streptomyces cahuitamycinicus]